MNTNTSADAAISTYNDMLSRRAFQEGYAAYLAGMECHAPARFSVFSGNWVEGWMAAADDNRAAPGAKQETAIPEEDLNAAKRTAKAVPRFVGSALYN